MAISFSTTRARLKYGIAVPPDMKAPPWLFRPMATSSSTPHPQMLGQSGPRTRAATKACSCEGLNKLQRVGGGARDHPQLDLCCTKLHRISRSNPIDCAV